MEVTPVLLLGLGLLTAPIALAHGWHDSDYHEVILFPWDTAQIDIIINLPVTPHSVWRIASIEQSIDAWEAGIAAYAPAWMVAGIQIDHYTVGLDIIPPAALADPEIIVTTAEPGVLGIGAPTDFIVCGSDSGNPATPSGYADSPLAVPWVHHHQGSPWTVVRTSCAGLGNTCFATSTNWETYQNGMYDLNAHEFGHCLGIGHVGDANDFHATTFPATDIMSYQHDPSQVHCVSNMNVLAMQWSFADILGGARPPVENLTWGGLSYVRVAPASYAQVACPNPAAALIPDPDWFPL